MNSFLKQYKWFDTVALLMIALAGIAMLYLWRLNPEFRTLHVGDAYLDANQFIPGANFHQLGFIKLRFTADYAIGPEAYHPFYYTHNPPLSEIINGLYHRLGLVRIEQQRLVCILWTLIGFIFFYATLKLLTTPAIALVGLIFAVTNPYVIYWGDNLFSSHQWMFIYVSLYFFLRYIRKPAPSFLIISWAACFSAAFSNYVIVPFLVFFALGLKLFRLENISRRQLLIFLSAPLAAFLLRNLLVVWAVGYQDWFSDFAAALLRRSLGVNAGSDTVYERAPILVWSANPQIPRNYPWLLYKTLEGFYGYGWSLFLAALMLPFARKYLLPRDIASKLFRLILLFFVMGITWYLLFPQQTSRHFHSHEMLPFFPFACLLWGTISVGLWQNIKFTPLRIICVIVILFALCLARTVNFVPAKPFPGIDVLPKYKGKIFCTDSVPTLVEYYTAAPAAYCIDAEQFKELKKGQCKFFLYPGGLPMPQPELFFSIYRRHERELLPFFPIIEKGENYAIYDLRGVMNGK